MGSKESKAARPAGEVSAERVAELEASLARTNAALQRLELDRVSGTHAASAADSAAPTETSAPWQASSDHVGEEAAREEETRAQDQLQRAYPERREKAFFEAYFTELDVAMAAQPSDRNLARRVQQLMSTVDQGFMDGVDLRCSQEICRIEARYRAADPATRDRFVTDLQSALAPELSQATIHLPTDESRLLGYFARKGMRLPPPTTSFASFMHGEG
jgi:hypothetical protein